MDVKDFWKNNKKSLLTKSVDQIIHFFGDGKLADNSNTSKEFRELLNLVSTDILKRYCEECLVSSFENSGFALQDIINEIGIRLGYKCEHGVYRGRKNIIGFDGIWTINENYRFLVEVKTTDTYRINLDNLARYREKLIESKELDEKNSSILIVVGRKDTGDLEAQIRGSKHAWDIRLISTDALIKLMLVKENLNDQRTFHQINQILKPVEYTKIDKLIDVIFYTAEDLQLDENQVNEDNISHDNNLTDFTIDKIENHLKTILVKQGRRNYTDTKNEINIISLNSKMYSLKNNKEKYWYSIRLHQKEFLDNGGTSYVSLGCGTPTKNVLLIPYKVFKGILPYLGITKKEKGDFYYHVEVYNSNSTFVIRQNNRPNIDVSEFLI
ncbi:hypothetical protein MHH37_17275 [Solibacillus sp. FSL K6-1781]|uniref:hypothetical protein n=1 Tax=Solibacillus sp. FSL K6-1781 TaxID=2921474 RepID=UPI003159F15F